MVNSKMKAKNPLPTQHERAPKVAPEVTPALKGGDLENKLRHKQKNKAG